MTNRTAGATAASPRLSRKARRAQAAEAKRLGRIDAVHFELRHMAAGCGRLHLVSRLADGTEVHACLSYDDARAIAVEMLSRLPLEGVAS